MPTTINGIGTHYYGKKNKQVRTAHCRSCGNQGRLESYDTRLWFVIFFVPVVPLGRKRIIDSCWKCKRHFVAGADQFAVTSQLTVSEGREKYRTDPSIESALDAHARMLGFHKHEEADAFREEAAARFPQDAVLLAGFAQHLAQVSRYDASGPLYEQAYALDPELPEARIGMAFIQMNQGKFDEARATLNFMESPGAGQVYSLTPLKTLATLYQKNNRHAEALQIFQHLLTEYPEASQLHAVRQIVRMSEKKVKGGTSILPKRTASWFQVFNPWSREFSKNQHSWALLGLVVALVCLGLVANNEFIRRHRTLHILSGLDSPVTVQVDDQPPISVQAHEEVTVAEGPHHISVSGRVKAEYDINLDSSIAGRFFKTPVWIVNVAGTAALIQTHLQYSRQPTPPAWTLLAGKTFVTFPHVDYPFVEPPKTVELPRGGRAVTKLGLQIVSADPISVAARMPIPAEALALLEAHLASRPQDARLFETYQQRTTADPKFTERAEAFLRAGLARRPTEINWHRTYQNILEEQGRTAAAIAFYDAALAKEPQSGELMYLKARLEPDSTAALALLERAKELAPQSPWPWYSLAYHSLSRGEWSPTLERIQQASRLGIDPTRAQAIAHFAQLGLGQFDPIVSQCREALQAEPQNLTALMILIDALAAQGKKTEAVEAFHTWKNANPALQTDPNYGPAIEVTRMLMLYELGDLESLAKSLPAVTAPAFRDVKSALWLATAQPDQITGDPDLAKEFDNSWNALSLSVACHLAGQDQTAERWRQKAAESLRHKGVHEQQAAAILTGQSAPNADAVSNLILDPHQKLVLICALVQKFPDAREPLTELARKLNVSRAPPYQLISRALSHSREAASAP